MAGPKRRKNCMSENLLTLLTVIGVFVGVVFGLILKNVKSDWTERQIMYIRYPGDIFLSMLSGLILPLIVASIVSAIGNLDLGLSGMGLDDPRCTWALRETYFTLGDQHVYNSGIVFIHGKIGLRSIFYYSTTTVSAVILGIILVLTIRPGYISGSSFVADRVNAPEMKITTTDTMLDLIRNIFPSNIVQACIQHYQTVLKEPGNMTDDSDISNWTITSKYVDGTNTLGIVIFGIVFGIALAKMGEAGEPVLNFFNSLSEAMMIITSWVIWISPIGVMCLVTSKLLEIQNFGAIVGQLGFYFLTVVLGLILHGFGTLTIIFFVCTRKLPFKVISQLGQVMVTAFGTSSSSATLPITLQCLDSMGMDPRITRFVVPIGATINMDGTALYEAVAAIFIAQVRGIELSFINVIAISITATAASVGAAGIPQAGLITMVMVLNTVGLPAEDVTLIIAVDWLLDRFRTTINVMCDALGAVIIEHMSKGELDAVTINREEDNVELAQLRKTES